MDSWSSVLEIGKGDALGMERDYLKEYVERREKQVAAEMGNLMGEISALSTVPRLRVSFIGWGLQGQWINLSVF